MRTAEDIKLGIADVDKKIRAKQKQIQALEKEVDKLREAQKALNTELYELKREEQTEKLLQSVFAVTKRNSTEETLSSFTYTTNLMDKFVNSKKRFLLFKHAFRIGAWRYVTLVVTKCRWDVRYHYSGLVMTDLKKAVGAHVTEDSLRYTREGSRLYPLYSELVAIGQKQMEKGEYSLTSHGGYQYVDSHFVLDRPRYLTYDTDGTMALTEYARTHMDECCLIFNMKMKAQNEVDNRYHRICYLNRGKGGYDFDLTFHGGYENAPQERQDAFLQQQLEEEARIADKMTGDPRVCAEILLKWRKTTYEKLAGEIGISDKTISRMFNRKVKPKQDAGL